MKVKPSTMFFVNVSNVCSNHPIYYNIHGPPLGFVFQLLQLCAKIYLMTASEAEAIMAKEWVSLKSRRRVETTPQTTSFFLISIRGSSSDTLIRKWSSLADDEDDKVDFYWRLLLLLAPFTWESLESSSLGLSLSSLDRWKSRPISWLFHHGLSQSLSQELKRLLLLNGWL